MKYTNMVIYEMASTQNLIEAIFTTIRFYAYTIFGMFLFLS